MLLSFLKLELKNSLRAVKKTIFGTIIAIILLTAAAAAVSFVIGYDNTVDPLKAAIIMHDDDSLTRMLIRYVSQTDSIKSISEFEYMDEADAFKALDNGETDIVIDLPEDFFNDVNNGVNTPLDIYMREDAGFITDMFAKVVVSGTGYVRTTEAAVYAFIDVSGTGERTLLLSDSPIGDHIASVYASGIMHRLRIFDSVIVSEYGQMSVYRFYFMTLIMIILLYSGLNFGYLYDRETCSIADKLRVYGVGRSAVCLVREGVMTLHMFILTLAIYAAALAVQGHADIEIITYKPYHLPVLLGLCVSYAVLYNLIYMIAGDDNAAKPVILLLMLTALLLSGLIVPYSRMPGFVPLIGRVIPHTYMREYFASFVYDGAGSLIMAVLLLPITVAEQFAGVLWVRR